MIDLMPLFRETNAYRTVREELSAGRLSHAYLVLSADGENLPNYLKILAKMIVADGDERAEDLIERGVHPDVLTFPVNGKAVLKEDVAKIIEESYLKPVEGDRKLFLINDGESMLAVSQNKLLKTLEEPPKGVCIIIGATSEFPLLSTVKSRLKKLVIPPYDNERLFNALKDDCPVTDRLIEAIACGDGTVGKAVALYKDEELERTIDIAVDVICNMQTSRSVLEYSVVIAGSKDGISGFLPVFQLLIRDMLAYHTAGDGAVSNKKLFDRIKNAQGFSTGACVRIAESITEAQRRLNANANPQAVTEWLLFATLEGKHIWQKL